MSKIVTGKGESKYEIHISTKSLPKQTLNTVSYTHLTLPTTVDV